MTGLDPAAFRARIVEPTLRHLQLWSPAAEWLVLATAVHESGLSALIQVGGPALGVYQIEAETYFDVIARLTARHHELAARLGELKAEIPAPLVQLVSNLAYATAVCRLIYYLDPEPLPPAGARHALAWYWKRVYNTDDGAGTVPTFLLHNQNIA